MPKSITRSYRKGFTLNARKSVGFTLIELLVVIGIIALLAAIIFPVFAAARGKARQIACISSLRQVGIAMQMYTQDYDGLYPYGKDASDDAVPQIWQAACRAKLRQMSFLHPNKPSNGAGEPVVRKDVLPGLLDPYVKNLEVWRCQGDTGFDTLDNNDSCNGPCYMKARPTMYEAFGASYLFRTEIAFRGKGIDNMDGLTWDGKEVDSSQINVIFDGNGSWHGQPFALGRSGLRYNTLFGDGHAKMLTNEQYQMAWATQLDATNRFAPLCQ